MNSTLRFAGTFERVELKYLLNEQQYTELRRRVGEIAHDDAYGETLICNVYYDTPDYALIRRSLAKPKYKEKLRIRSYGIPTGGDASVKGDGSPEFGDLSSDRDASGDSPASGSPTFIEIKKKYNGIVYKRRVALPYDCAMQCLRGEKNLEDQFQRDQFSQRQISREIEYFMGHYEKLRPAMGITYRRIAMAGNTDPGLRITFDRDLRWQDENLSLQAGSIGAPILQPGQHLMELKIADAIPLSIVRMLSDLKIRQVSFSKYGRAYEMLCSKEEKEKHLCQIYYFNPSLTARTSQQLRSSQVPSAQ